MGLDVLLFLGRLPLNDHGKDHRWFQVHAAIELDFEGRDLAEVFEPRKGTLIGLFPLVGDGDTEIFKDRYATALQAFPIADLLGALPPPSTELARLVLLRAMIAAAPPWLTHFVLFCH